MTFGSGGQNTVNYDQGDGAVTVNPNGGSGTISFGPGITASQVTLQADSAGDVTVSVDGTGDSVLIEGDLYSSWGTRSQLSPLLFADGSTLSLSSTPFTWTGTAPDTSLVGTGWGANVFDLAPGGDTVTFGSGGQNTVNYDQGDGMAVVNINSDSGNVVLGSDLTPDDVSFSIESNHDVVLTLTATGETLTIRQGGTSIQDVMFADGTKWTPTLYAQTQVGNLYEDVLGRMVDPSGLNTYSQEILSGTSIQQVRTTLATSQEEQSDLAQAYDGVAGQQPGGGVISTLQTAIAFGATQAQVDAAIASEFPAGDGTVTSTPALSGVVGDQSLPMGDAVQPFAALAVTDPNSQQVETAVVSLSGGTDSLSNLGDGSLSQDGSTYTVSGTAMTVQADLQALILTSSTTSSNHTTTVGLTVTNLLGSSSDATVDLSKIPSGTGPAWTFLYGTGGSDVLTASGGPMRGPDQFILSQTSFGNEVINGFDPTHDLIQLSGATVANFKTIQTDMVSAGGGTLITLTGNQSILLHGVSPDSLHASNFGFA